MTDGAKASSCQSSGRKAAARLQRRYWLSCLSGSATVGVWSGQEDSTRILRPGKPTFNKDIAPLIFNHCAPCHRPVQAAPFNLLTYARRAAAGQTNCGGDAKPVYATWLPEPGHGQFVGEQRSPRNKLICFSNGLLEAYRKAIQPICHRCRSGKAAGNLGARFGCSIAAALSSPGQRPDVYRILSIPVPLSPARYVEAVEFDPGNPRVAHHAFMYFDRTGQSRRLDERMGSRALMGCMPQGARRLSRAIFLAGSRANRPRATRRVWPGRLRKVPTWSCKCTFSRREKSRKSNPRWRSILPTGPPTNRAFKLGLRFFDIDIPAGQSDYALEQTYGLPVDVQLLALLPHAHIWAAGCTRRRRCRMAAADRSCQSGTGTLIGRATTATAAGFSSQGNKSHDAVASTTIPPTTLAIQTSRPAGPIRRASRG